MRNVFKNRNIWFWFIIFSFSASQPLYSQFAKWRVFHSAEGAFSIEMPDEPKYMSRTDSVRDSTSEVDYVQTKMYTAENYSGAYVLAYYTYPPGIIFTDHKEAFSGMSAMISQLLGGAVAEEEDTEFDGYPARNFTIRLINGTAYRAMAVMRGARIYLILAGANDDMLYSTDIERFFTSFRFKTFTHVPKKTFSFKNQGFAVNFPAEPVIDTTDAYEEGDNHTFQALDTNSSISYIVSTSRFGEYEDIIHADSVLVNSYRPAFYNRTDTILSVKKSMIEGNPAHEIEKMTKGDPQIYRMLFILRGDMLYQFFVYLPKDLIKTAPVNDFFNSVSFLPYTPRYDVYSRKADKILKDITSSDTLRQQKAEAALRLYDFKTEELPKIYTALQKSYPDDSLEYGSIRQTLFRKLEEIRDTTTVNTVAKIYSALPANNYFLKRSALQSLRSINTQQSLELLTDLIISEKWPSDVYDYGIYQKWNDSLKNYRYMFPKILQVFKNDTVSSNYYSFIREALDSGIVSRELVQPYLPAILTAANSNLKKLRESAATKDSIQSEYYAAAGILTTQAALLGYFPENNSAVLQLEELLKTDYPYLTVEAVTSLLKNGKSAPTSVLEPLAADSSIRLELFRNLEAIGALDKFPAKYLSQESISLSLMYEWLNSEEMYYERIEPIGEHIIKEGDTAGRYFLYKYMNREDDEEVWYTGMSGPQPLDSSQIKANVKSTYSEYQKLEELSPQEHFELLLKKTQQWNKE